MDKSNLSDTGPGTDATIGEFLANKYRIVRRIGKGGVGNVYEALHVDLNKHVAVKILHKSFCADTAVVGRMRVEARALASLASPHLVEVTDFGLLDDGRPFMVMPLLHGRPLSVELRQRRYLPAEEALALMLQTLTGLDVAHQAGFVHRDIKPGNLFLCASAQGGTVLKILDFGIAKVLSPSSPVAAMKLTEAGMVVGTPRYMAPEQGRGSPVDARTDIYSAGVVLYQLVVGHDPFSSTSGFIPLVTAHAFGRVRPPSEVAPQAIPAALDAAILKALEKSPADRHASAGAFAAALREVLRTTTFPRPTGLSPSTPPPSGQMLAKTLPMSAGPLPIPDSFRPESLRPTEVTSQGARQSKSSRRSRVAVSFAVLAAAAAVTGVTATRRLWLPSLRHISAAVTVRALVPAETAEPLVAIPTAGTGELALTAEVTGNAPTVAVGTVGSASPVDPGSARGKPEPGATPPAAGSTRRTLFPSHSTRTFPY